MKQWILFVSALGFLGGSLASVRAAAPANDNFASRIALSGAVVTTSGSTVEATTEAGEPFHYTSGQTNGGHSVWWSWTAPVSGQSTITTAGSSYDTILAIYTGAAVNALTLITNNDDDSVLGTATSRTVFNATAGTTYQIAVDGFGGFPNGTTGSVTLNISGAVPATPITLVSTGSVWKYLDDGTDPGTAWRAVIFNDAGWSNGVSQLGFGDNDEATLIRSNRVSDSSRIISYYFRREFVLTNASAFVGLNVHLLRDDGAVVYLNSNEVFRSNMPGGAITNLTLASSSAQPEDETTRYYSNSISPALLVNGTNVIAVEVHQNLATSSDLTFELALHGLSAASNAPPTITLTSPSVSSTSAAPASFTLNANASDPDGSVARVDFYTNSAIVGTDLTAPFSLAWSNVVAGNYAIRAVAFDAFGATGTSAPVSLVVTGNVPPFAAISSPSEGATFSAPASITINATAGDLDGSVTNVEFYQGTTRIGQDASSPFAFASNGVPVGNYALRVVATDNTGARGTSAVVNVTVNPNTPPAISLTNPPNNAVFAAPANITLAANATDLEAPVASVAFYTNAVLLGTDVSSPFTFDWSGVATGSYALRAIATDAGGLTATSSVVNITVQAAGTTVVLTNFLISSNSAGWKYLDNNVDQGTAWQARLFNDTTWSNGVAQLGFGDFDEATIVSSNQQVTTYFRKSFVVNNASTYTNLQLWLLRDDGGAVYLNGTEVFRTTNMPANFTFSSLTVGPAPPDNSVDITNVNAGVPLLINGTNVIAVEIHQSALISSDISMDLQLIGVSVLITGSNAAPTAVITSPANNASFNPPPATIVIDAGASDSDDTVAKVEFYSNNVKIGEDLTAPYSYTNSGVGSGNYVLAVVAQDTFGARGTSAPVNVTVTGVANQPPTVALTNPPSGTFNAPTNLLLQASATDSDGSVAKVEFFRSGVKIGEDTIAPFALDWTNVLVGIFQMTAVATDNGGLTATSIPVSMTFTGLGPVTFIASGNSWKYLDNGTDQGAAWQAVVFDDSTWASGPSQLGYSSNPPENDEATVISFGPNPSQKYVTYYFRRSFVVANPGAYSFLTIRLLRDDGAVVYLNGSEVFRSNIGANPTYTTFASLATDDGTLWFTNTASASLLVTGTNVIAVEVHNSTAGSSDISFDLELIGNTGAIVNNPPAVAISSPANNSTYTEPANLTLNVTASDSDGSVTNVAFYVNGVKLGDDATAPYSFNWNNVPLGNYALTAVATDNFSATNLSSTVNVFVTASTAPTLVSRTPSASSVNSLTQISVQFSEPVDGVDAADLLINGAPASSVTGSNANYTFSFQQPMDGIVAVRLASGAGIADRETPPKPFDPTATNASWQYTLADNSAPTVIALTPQPGATLKSLSEISVTFSEAVGGVNASDLRLNGAGATSLSGSGAGPYKFSFAQPTNSPVTVAWTNTHGIRDFAATPNNFAGGTWSYTLNTNLVETNLVISEIMYHPFHNQAAFVPEPVAEEYVELFNPGGTAVNLAGWSFSGGLAYTFSNLTLNAGAYLVLAADRQVFTNKYPWVTNVVGNFTGRLGNSDDRLNLDSPLGDRIDSVHYTDEGEWAMRRFLPADNAPSELSWEWTTLADGGGSSLELINAALPNQYGQNWSASSTNTGSPGRANSVATNNVAPLILDATHAPAVPASSNNLFISARLLDEQTTGVTGILYWRVASVAASNSLGAFNSTNLLDDGLHGDGLANDGVFGATLPPQPNQTIIEYYLLATDAGGRTRTWPAPTEANGTQGANALLQVDDDAYTGTQPIFRLVLTGPENQRLADLNRNNANANVQMNAAFISTDGVQTQVRQRLGVRHRGAGSRGAQPPNLRVRFPRDARWNNVSGINLNTRYTWSQVAGSLISRKAGLTSEEAVGVQVRRSGTNSASSGSTQFGSYSWVESRDSDWVANHYPNDANGNLYTATRPSGGLTTLGSYSPASLEASGYQKDSNQSENDYTDVADLISVLNRPLDAQYPVAVRQRVNVAQWMKHLAVLSLVGYGETALFADGAPDDYTLFRGLNDTRFQIVPHDHDTDFGKGDSPRTATTDSIFRAADGSSVVNRFLRHQEFVPLYYQELQRLLETTFQPAEISRLFDQAYLGWPVAAQTIFDVKNWMTNRYYNVLTQIPTNLTVTHSLPIVSGYPQTITGTIALSGFANAITTRSVRVNGQAATWTAWQAAWSSSGLALPPGISRVVVQSLDAAGAVLQERTLDVWYDDSSTANVSGAIAGNQTLTAAGGPYLVTGNVTIGNGATLTLQPGTTLYLNSGVSINVSGTGRLLAEGTEGQRIRFTRTPGSATTWGSLDLVNASLESRIAYADLEACGGTTLGGHTAMMHVNNSRLFMSHCIFTNTPAIEYISFDNSSFIVQNSVFPTYPYATSAPEMLHGVNGIPANGYGIFRDNYFGHTWGFNDTIDFTGGQRPAAILQVINNIFDGAADDHLDLDSTDAWIEGNLFLHAHRDPNSTAAALDTASAISGGTEVAGQFSEWTIINNLFYDVDHVLLNKGATNAPGAGRFIFINNTLVHVNKENGAGLPGDIAAFNFTDDNVPLPDPAYGAGGYVAGNILWDCPALVANYNPANHTVLFENNLLSLPWSGPGTNNVVADPLLNLSLIANPLTADWRTVKAALTPKAGSPALGSGVGGFDRGGMNPRGLLVWGEPSGLTPLTTATLRVGPGGTFNWGTNPPVPPYVWGYTFYKWKLDNGPWSAETSVTSNATISLSGLSDGPHTVYVVGKNDAGYYQDDALVYPATAGLAGHSTASRTWYVNQMKSPVLLSEVLARNDSAVPVGAKFPDLVELYNPGPGTVSLAGLGLTDEADQPFKFTFPAGASIGAGQYLVLYADNDATPPGFHLGFSLKGDGDELFLTSANGMTLDSVVFGPQLADRSIGRGSDGAWRLNQPTFGAANVALPAGAAQAGLPTGEARLIKINEWLASGLSPYPDDFIELFNPGSVPVNLGGSFLTDNPIGTPFQQVLAPLSFIPAGGYLVYAADGNASAGPTHVNFKLRAEQGLIGLIAADGSIIDCVIYGPQSTDVSMGRQPNGAATYGFFALPTPGSPNPGVIGVNQAVVINEVLAWNISKKAPDGSTPDWVELYNPTGTNFDLGDLSLSDNALLPRKFVFPPGLIVPALGYFSLRLDPDIPTGATNAGFGLKSTGQALYLFDKLASGGGQLSAVSFGVQAADFSIGRVPNGSTNWVLCVESIGFANTAVVPGSPDNLRVNEWMANPASGDDWFEVFNPNAQPVALGGLHLSDRLDTPLNRMKHKIPPLSYIGVAGWAYQRFEADSTVANGPDHVSFSLAAGGEQLGISGPAGALINGVNFFAQAVGVSQGRLPDGGAVITNFPGTASPGDPNYLLLTNVVINEALTHSDPPFEDAIEVRNLSAASVNIGGWFISDAKHELGKFRIPNGTILPANGFKVFNESQFNDTNSPFAFALSSAKGDEIYLGQATAGDVLTGYRAQASFGAAENSVSFGRYVTSVGEAHFVAMSARTFGQDFPDTTAQFRLGTGLPNAYPKVGPIVIGEIMYHPPDLGTNDDTIHEFIELRNLSGSAQPLFHPVFTTNSWKLKDAVSFTFAPGTSIPGFGYLLVVSFNPTNALQLAEFRSYYGLSPAVAIAGPWNGKLDNGGESIELIKPDAPQPDGDVPQILVERVKYSDAVPWATNRVDGGGFSLQRINPDEYGNDPINWTAAAPTPGPAAGADSDGDGMPDAWELQYGLNAGVNDANGDLDLDGVSNLNEYLSGTLPNDPSSFLKLTIVGTGPVTLQFNAAASLGYSIEFKNTLNAPMWTTLTNVAAGVARPVQIIDPTATGATRFYRLRTP